MYSYEWDPETKGILLTPNGAQFVAFEIRPVFAEELIAAGMDSHFIFDHEERRPLMWSLKNFYYADGERLAQMNNVRLGEELNIKYFFEGTRELVPVDVDRMVEKNSEIMGSIVSDTKRRAKELFDEDQERCDTAYIAFSGGKDSLVLLDICNRVLPTFVSVIYSDTDMELPDSYKIWDVVQKMYPEREFIRARAESRAIDNWVTFGPPARGIRWCCSVHKSTPAIITLKKKLFKDSIRVMAFVGVRGDESHLRSLYEDSGDGKKNASQINKMPILDWGSHEVWLYIFAQNLPINDAYRKGLPRVGCVMCPESSAKYEWFMEKAYPGILGPYNKVIIETSSKTFRNKVDELDFLANMGWQARKSGTLLSENVSNPMESVEGNDVTLIMGTGDRDSLMEWMKTLGTICEENGVTVLKRSALAVPIPIRMEFNDNGRIQIDISFNDEEERKRLIKPIKNILRKTISCVGCRTCEAECTHGAITFNDDGKVSIDALRCVRCQKCLELDLGCWRFRSMYKPDSETVRTSNINQYFNFGIRENDSYTWISNLVEMGADFFPYVNGHPLGVKMVDSASKWFQQALLVTPRTRQPTKLVDVFRKEGSKSKLGWELIWIALANNSTMIKWFVTNTEIGKTYTVTELADALHEFDPSLSKSNVDGGLAALKDMVTKSPVGEPGGFVQASMKGRTVQTLTRITHDVEPLTVLYSLYLIAQETSRNAFSISRDFIDCDFGSSFIPPTYVFNIPVDEFKKICVGLQSKYPDFIELTFTHGNDGIEVFPDRHSLDDVLDLVLRD